MKHEWRQVTLFGKLYEWEFYKGQWRLLRVPDKDK